MSDKVKTTKSLPPYRSRETDDRRLLIMHTGCAPARSVVDVLVEELLHPTIVNPDTINVRARPELYRAMPNVVVSDVFISDDPDHAVVDVLHAGRSVSRNRWNVTLTDPDSLRSRGIAMSRGARALLFSVLSNHTIGTIVKDSGLDISEMKGTMAIFRWTQRDAARKGISPREAKAALMKELTAERQTITDKARQLQLIVREDEPVIVPEKIGKKKKKSKRDR